MAENLFLQISLLLAVAVGVAFVIRLMRQPLLVAYIITGIVVGPLVLNIIDGELSLYGAFAKFGVVLLLFVVGLGLNLNYIKKIGRVAVVTGVCQVILTSLIGATIMLALRFPLLPSIYLGIAVTFSSTIVITKLLNEKKHSESMYGRYVVGLMLVQDFIAIIIMIGLGMVKQEQGFYAGALPMVLKTLFLIALVYLLARYIVPILLKRIANSGEFLFVFTVAWCLGIASLVYWLGFSMEIGAIIAGLSLGSSPYQPEISGRVKPLRDFFIVIFFIILGSGIKMDTIGPALVPAMALSTYILIGNPLILYFLYRMMKFNRRNSFLSALTASQVSEFGFVLLFTGVGLGHLSGDEMSIFTLVALITFFVSSYLITFNEQIYFLLKPYFSFLGKDKKRQDEEPAKTFYVWVFGYHRIGWKVCEALIEKKIKFAVVDYNPETIAKLKKRGIPAYFGDASDVEFLEGLPLEKAKLIISTLPTVEDQQTLIRHAKTRKKAPFVIASLFDENRLDDLYELGVDYVMMPHLLGGQRIYDVLKGGRWDKDGLKKLKQYQKEEYGMRLAAFEHGK